MTCLHRHNVPLLHFVRPRFLMLLMSTAAQVRDMIFLHKYNEPVLLILHETEPTWAGMARHKHDTMALTALSINTVAQQHPKIWGATRLPSDAHRLVAVPSGGALVLCQNMILYHSQVRRPCQAGSQPHQKWLQRIKIQTASSSRHALPRRVKHPIKIHTSQPL